MGILFIRFLGGIYTRTLLRKPFLQIVTLYIVSQCLLEFISLCWKPIHVYTLNSNTGSLVIVGCGLMQDEVNIACQIRILPVSNHFSCLQEENERCDVVPFLKYMLLLPDLKAVVFIARFHQNTINEQLKLGLNGNFFADKR